MKMVLLRNSTILWYFYFLNVTSSGTQASGYLQRLWIQSGHQFKYETVSSLLNFDDLNEKGTFT